MHVACSGQGESRHSSASSVGCDRQTKLPWLLIQISSSWQGLEEH